jgi:hypothetical protein
MAGQEVLNSTNNINIPDTVSMWFQQDFTGDFTELGDLIVDGISLTPEFLDFRSYRNGLNSIRKRLLTATAATMTLTLNEPNIVNLQRVVFGGAIATGDTVTALEGRHLTVERDGAGEFIDLATAGETAFGDITVTGMYLTDDVTEATNLLSANGTVNTDGQFRFDGTDAGAGEGTIVYLKYSISMTSMLSSEIFGSTTATIQGAARFQARNEQGGVTQIWDLASVSLAPNGDMPFPLDAIQTIPLTATLEERSGTFGKVYTT